jgi:hypothetical protein
MGNEFKVIKQRLEAVRKAEAAAALRAQVGADDDATGAEYRRARTYAVRRREREAVLDAHVPDRRCPVCGTVKPQSRAWVVCDRFDVATAARCGHPEAILLLAAAKGSKCVGCRACVYAEPLRGFVLNRKPADEK